MTEDTFDIEPELMKIWNNECPKCGHYMDVDQEKCIECGYKNKLIELGMI